MQGEMQLEEIRRLAEERNQAIGREYYPHGAGLKDTLDLASVLDRFASLNEVAVIRRVQAALQAETDPTEKRRLAYLFGDCLEGYLNAAVAPVMDQLANAEAQRTITVAGRTLPFRQAAVMMANEPDRLRRLAIEEARAGALAATNDLRWQALERTRELIRDDLGYAGYTAFYQEVRQVDFPAFGALMARFLHETDALYRARLASWTEEELGVSPDACYRHDLTYMLRAVKFDACFPEARLKSTLKATLANLGLDIESQANIILDLEPRPTKSPRAFMVAAQVPDEVYLVISPHGGRDDYAAILHECGHAEHFGNTRRELPYEFRWLGDYAVTECHAFTLELLTLDAGWLAQHLGMDAPQIAKFQRYAYTVLFYLFRRYAAKLQFELALHDDRPLAGKERLYTEIMEAHLGVTHMPELALADVDAGFYCANYLRAWIMWAQLRRYMRGTFGADWFNRREAGDFLKGLWSLGQSLPAELLVRQFGYDGLDIGPLMDEFAAVLGTTAERPAEV